MTQKRLLLAFSGIIAIVAILSCNSEFSGYEKTDSGIYYKIFPSNDTTSAKVGDVLTLGMTYKVSDSVLFDNYTDTKPFQIRLSAPQYEGDVLDSDIITAIQRFNNAYYQH